MTYEGQLQLKRKQIVDKLVRLGGLEDPKVNEIIGADTLYLKACDSRDEIKTVEDFYDHGHVLPIGRADFKVIIKLQHHM